LLLLLLAQLVLGIDQEEPAAEIISVRTLHEPDDREVTKEPVGGQEVLEPLPDFEHYEEPDDPPVEPAPVIVEAERAPEVSLGDSDAARTAQTRLALAGGGASLYARRGAQGRRAAAALGMTRASEEAVVAALRWLARHQDDDGKWSRSRYYKHDGRAKPRRELPKESQLDLDPAVSGLALLAFLGRGYTHKKPDEARPQFQQVVANGFRYLERIQRPDGQFGPWHGRMMYNQAICTLVAAEGYGMTGDATLRELARRGVGFLVRAQQDNGGWDYTPDQTGRNDTSITGWVVMALKSGRASGLEIPWKTLLACINHFDQMTTAGGLVTYADKPPGVGRKGPAMIAVGLVSRLFLGWDVRSPELRRQADRLLRFPPLWHRLDQVDRPLETYYYWYYATIGMFQMGGKYREFWDRHLQPTLLQHQRRGGRVDGSWDPKGVWARMWGGRVYTTAINALNLEVYYRYLPLYEVQGFDAVQVLQKAREASNADLRRYAVRILSGFTSEAAVDLLLEALEDENKFVRLGAAKALAARQDRRSVSALVRLAQDPQNSFVRGEAATALGRIAGEREVPVFIGLLEDAQPFVRRKAIQTLQRLARRSFDFTAEASPARRAQAVRRWRDWWKRSQGRLPESDDRLLWGKVEAVSPDGKRLLLSLGRTHRVTAGLSFEIFRGGKAIGTARVVHAGKAKSQAVITSAPSAARIVAGDLVKGRLP